MMSEEESEAELQLNIPGLSPELEELQNWLFKNAEELDLALEQQCSVLFIIRLCDALHSHGNATFITDSFVSELKLGFRVPFLNAEFEMGAIRWSCASYYSIHPVAGGVDGDALRKISKIASGASHGDISAQRGHELLSKLENDLDEIGEDVNANWFKRFIRSNWGLYLIYPLGAASYGMIFFGATAMDVGFGCISGLITAMIIHASNYFPALVGVAQILISVAASMVAGTANHFFPDSTCYTEQALGSITNFLYGTAFVISLYEITASNNLLLTGVTRFATAIFKTYILAAGVGLGCWMARFAGADRVDRFLNQDCSNLKTQPPELVRLLCTPIAFIAILLDVQVSPRYWPICFGPLILAFGSQYVLAEVLDQTVLIINVAPAYIATVSSYIFIALAQRCNLTDLRVSASGYLNQLSLPNINKKQVKRPRFSRKMGQRNIRVSSVVGTLAMGADEQKLHFMRSDLWFCLFPSLVLLVPGGSVWRVAFFSVLAATWPNDFGSTEASIGQLFAGILTVAIGQVIGVRLGLATISLYATMKQEICGREKPFDNVVRSERNNRGGGHLAPESGSRRNWSL
jgi:hypothetical protein